MKQTKNLRDFIYFACVNNQKKPATKNGYYNAKVCSAAKLKNNDYNVGLPMRPNGLIAIDVDVKKGKTGIQDLKHLEEMYGKLPPTLKQKSCNGGFHLIFSDDGITKARGNLGNSIDIRWNGYLLCEPSIIDGNSYRFVEGIDVLRQFVTIAHLPNEWIKLINLSYKAKPKFEDGANSSTKKHKTQIIENCNFDNVFNQCQFLQYCKENSQHLSEPQWFTMISILAPAVGSEQLIHKLSAPYPNYSFEETELKIQRAKKFGKPPSCMYVSSNYPEICKNCQIQITKGENKQ